MWPQFFWLCHAQPDKRLPGIGIENNGQDVCPLAPLRRCAKWSIVIARPDPVTGNLGFRLQPDCPVRNPARTEKIMACIVHHWPLRRGAQRGRHPVVGARPQPANGNDHAVARGLRAPRSRRFGRLMIEDFRLTAPASHTPFAAPVIFYRLRGDPTFAFLYRKRSVVGVLPAR